MDLKKVLMMSVLVTTSTLRLYGDHHLGCLCPSCSRARDEGRAEASANSSSANAFTFTYVEEPYRPPRYPLGRGIDIAIENVRKVDAVLTTQRVLEELDRMASVNDIQLPYSYSSSSKTRRSISGRLKGFKTRKWLSPEQAKRKASFEQWVAQKVDAVMGDNPTIAREPVPRDYAKKDDFVNAYADYKMSTVNSEIIERYSRKIGGLYDYRREMKNVASRIWQHSK